MSVIQENRDVLLKELRVARVLPTLRKHLPEFLITEVENQLTIRRKNEKLLDILRKREDGTKLLRIAIESSYPNLMYIFGETSSEDENAPPRPPPPRAAPKRSLSKQISDDLFKSAPRPSDYKGNNLKADYKPITTSAPKVMPKPKIVVTPRYNPPHNGIAPNEQKEKEKKKDDDRIKLLQDENDKLKKEVEDKDGKLRDLELAATDNSLTRDLARLKTKYENLEREKDMVVTEKLAMETEQSIILKENEFLKKMKASAVSKREVVQHLEDKEHAEQARDEAVRESQRLRREFDELQRQIGDVTYEKDLREDERRRETRDRSRLEKECERLREELQEERKHAQKLSNSSVPLPQYEKLQDELDETRKDVRTANRERDTALQEKNTLLMERKSGDSAEVRNLQDKLAQLQQAILKLTDEKNNIAFENAMLTDQLNAATAASEDTKNARTQVLEQNELMRNDIEHLLKEREGIMDELDESKKIISGNSDEKDATILALRQSLTNQQNISDEFESKFNDSERKLIKLREEFKSVSDREDSLVDERDTYKQNYSTVQSQLDQLTQERDMAMSDYDRIYKECEELKKELEAATGEKDVIVTDHQQALDEIEKLHNHIAQLERPQAASPPPVVAVEVARPVESRPPERVASPPPAPASYTPEDEDFIEDRDWRSEMKVIILNKAKHNARSFGFTIGGGIDNPHYKENPEDSHIYVLKVQQSGVADGVLHRDDAILSVNGNDLSKVAHEYAVSTLTSSGDCIELVIRRKFVPEAIKIINLSAYLERGLGFSIIGGKSEDVTQDPGIYIAKVLPGGAAEAEGVLDKGDRILTINGSYVVNVSRKYAEGLLGNLADQCVLRVAKPLSTLPFVDEVHVDANFSQAPYDKRGRSTQDLRRPSAGGRSTEDLRRPSAGGRSTEDLRRPMSPDPGLFGPPANFKDTRGINRAGSTPMLHDERLYQNHVTPPVDPFKRSSSQGNLLKNKPNQGYDLQRSRSQDWAPNQMMDPRNYAPSYAMRRINIKRPNLQTSLGLEVYTATSGQNGIFVNKLDKQGLSFKAGLRCADQILEVNGRNLRNATHDEAVGILSSNVNLNLICQQSPKQFGEMHQSMRSGFYVRALYSFSGGGPESALSFKEGDVFHVVDRESMEDDGWWLALLLRGATGIQCGEIPSHHRAIQFITQKFGPPQDQRGDKKGKKSLLGNVFKKDGRDGGSQSGSADDQYANDIVPYEPVIRKDLSFCRPIIILGPLTELLNDRLVNDCPDMFNRCILYTTRQPDRDEVNGRDFWFVNQLQIEDIQAGRDDDKFVECRHISGHTYYYSANAIKEVAKQGKHCVLNVGIHSIDRLHSVSLFPIVIFVKFKSAQDIRQQFNDRCSIEQAQKVFEKAVKLERGFSDKFSATFSGSSMEEVFLRIKEYIRDNATNVMWVRQN